MEDMQATLKKLCEKFLDDVGTAVRAELHRMFDLPDNTKSAKIMERATEKLVKKTSKVTNKIVTKTVKKIAKQSKKVRRNLKERQKDARRAYRIRQNIEQGKTVSEENRDWLAKYEAQLKS